MHHTPQDDSESQDDSETTAREPPEKYTILSIYTYTPRGPGADRRARRERVCVYIYITTNSDTKNTL